MSRTIIIRDNVSNIIVELENLKRDLDEDGSLFAILSTEYDDSGCVKFDFMDVIFKGISLGYDYINTIVYPSCEKQHVSFEDNVRYVVWLCNSRNKYCFNKDHIREKHIWKDVEWGKRAKNYNVKGKDPGNVWIPTEDDGKAHIIKHNVLSDKEVIAKLVKMTESELSNKVIYNQIDIKTQIDKNSNHESQELTNPRVIFSSSETMKEVRNGQLTTVITSPPYWNLKDYFKEGQIGQEDYNIYLNRMNSVWKECFDKLDDNGSMWININIRVQKNQVILIPLDIVKACKKIGFYYKGILIWHKSSGIPTNAKNIGDHHEYVLIFSKKKEFAVDGNVFDSFSDYKNNLINGGAFWNINRKAGSVGKKYIHPAIYPNELVSRIVLSSSNKGNVILDPFLGSGTSLISTVNANRSFIGYEYNEGFKDLMLDRFSKELDDSMTIDFIFNK